jgi:hypothetical protein
MRVCQFRHFGEWTTLQQRREAAEIRPLNPEDRFYFTGAVAILKPSPAVPPSSN